jgi:acetyl-CoA synthetase
MSTRRAPRAQSAATPAADVHTLLHAGLRWVVPPRFNVGQVCCVRWAQQGATAGRTAIAWEHEDGAHGRMSYASLHAEASRVAAALAARGVARGQRVALVLPQRPEMAVALMALALLGAVAVPLSMLFGPEALAYRLQDSGAVLAIVDAGALPAVAGVRAQCPALKRVVGVSAARKGRRSLAGADETWAALRAGRAATFAPADTAADDPFVLIYTSGTTGPPKGALVPHRALIGNLSGFVCSQNWFGLDGASDEVFWSPADWAWTGGLMDALLPALYFGRPIVAFQGRFQPERAFELMQRHRVTHSFLFPTALKAMMKAVPSPRQHYRLHLRGLMSAGEAVGDAVFHWCREALGVTVNEMFGQTEINYVVGNCGRWVDADGQEHPGWPARPGSMGRAYPGHRVAVIDEQGRECPRGTPGDVAVHRRDVHGHPRRGGGPPRPRARPPRPGLLPGLLEERSRHPRQVHRRSGRQLVPHGRHRGHGRRRLPLVPGPQRRRVQGRGLPHWPERGGELPGQAPGRGQRRRGAQARRQARRAGQGLRGAGAGLRGQ